MVQIKCPGVQRREQLFPFQTQKRYCSGCCMNTQSWFLVYMVFFRSLLNRSFFQKSAFIIIAASNLSLLWRPKYCISIMIRTTFSELRDLLFSYLFYQIVKLFVVPNSVLSALGLLSPSPVRGPAPHSMIALLLESLRPGLKVHPSQLLSY